MMYVFLSPADVRAAEQALDTANRELAVFALQQSELYKHHAATVAEYDEKVQCHTR